MSSRGYSAGAFRLFLFNIVDGSNLDIMPDDIVAAVDEARAIDGRCLICLTELVEPPTTFAVLYRARGVEPPLARGVCTSCARQCDRAELRRRAQDAFHRGPGA
jgi:hypothetical protein